MGFFDFLKSKNSKPAKLRKQKHGKGTKLPSDDNTRHVPASAPKSKAADETMRAITASNQQAQVQASEELRKQIRSAQKAAKANVSPLYSSKPLPHPNTRDSDKRLPAEHISIYQGTRDPANTRRKPVASQHGRTQPQLPPVHANPHHHTVTRTHFYAGMGPGQSADFEEDYGLTPTLSRSNAFRVNPRVAQIARQGGASQRTVAPAAPYWPEDDDEDAYALPNTLSRSNAARVPSRARGYSEPFMQPPTRNAGTSRPHVTATDVADADYGPMDLFQNNRQGTSGRSGPLLLPRNYTPGLPGALHIYESFDLGEPRVDDSTANRNPYVSTQTQPGQHGNLTSSHRDLNPSNPARLAEPFNAPDYDHMVGLYGRSRTRGGFGTNPASHQMPRETAADMEDAPLIPGEDVWPSFPYAPTASHAPTSFASRAAQTGWNPFAPQGNSMAEADEYQVSPIDDDDDDDDYDEFDDTHLEIHDD